MKNIIMVCLCITIIVHIVWLADEGSSPDPCSSTYHGASPESELEVQALTAEILSLNQAGRIQAFVDIHSFGYMWMHPWGNTDNITGECVLSEHDDDIVRYLIFFKMFIQVFIQWGGRVQMIQMGS